MPTSEAAEDSISTTSGLSPSAAPESGRMNNDAFGPDDGAQTATGVQDVKPVNR